MAGGVERALDYLAALGCKHPLLPSPQELVSRQPPACRPRPMLQSRTSELQQERVLVSDWLAANAAWRASADPAMPNQHASFLIERSVAMRRTGGLLPRRFVRACLDTAAASAAGAPLLVAWCLHEQGLIPLVEWLSLLRDEEQLAWGAALSQLHAMACWSDQTPPESRIRSSSNDAGHAAAAVCDGLLAAAAASAFQPDLADSAGMPGLGDGMREAGHDHTHQGWRGALRLAASLRSDDQPRGCARSASEAVLRCFLEEDSRDGWPGFSAGAMPAAGMSSVGHSMAGHQADCAAGTANYAEGRAYSAAGAAAMGRIGAGVDAQPVWRAARLVRAAAPSGRDQADGKTAARWVLEWVLEAHTGARAVLRRGDYTADCERGSGDGCRGSGRGVAELPSRLARAAETLDRMSWRGEKAVMGGAQPGGVLPGRALHGEVLAGGTLPGGAQMQRAPPGQASNGVCPLQGGAAAAPAAAPADRQRAERFIAPKCVCTGSMRDAYAELARWLEVAAGCEALVAMLLRWAMSPSSDGQRLVPWLAIARNLCRPTCAAPTGRVTGADAADVAPVPSSSVWDSAIRDAQNLLLDAPALLAPVIPSAGTGAAMPPTSVAAAGGVCDTQTAADASAQPEGNKAAANAPTRLEGTKPAMHAEEATLACLCFLHLDLCGCDVYSAAMAPRLQASLAPDVGRISAAVAPASCAARPGARLNGRPDRHTGTRLVRALSDLVPFLSLQALRLHQRLLRPFACPAGGTLPGVSELLDLLRTRVSDLEATGGGGGIGGAEHAGRQTGGESGGATGGGGAPGAAGGVGGGGGGVGACGGAEADPEEADAMVLFEEMLDFYRTHKALTRSAQQVRSSPLLTGR
jgi:hypothetical protein